MALLSWDDSLYRACVSAFLQTTAPSTEEDIVNRAEGVPLAYVRRFIQDHVARGNLAALPDGTYGLTSLGKSQFDFAIGN